MRTKARFWRPLRVAPLCLGGKPRWRCTYGDMLIIVNHATMKQNAEA